MFKRITAASVLIIGVTWLCVGSAAMADVACPKRVADPVAATGSVIDPRQVGLGATVSQSAAFGAPTVSFSRSFASPEAAFNHGLDPAAAVQSPISARTLEVCGRLAARPAMATHGPVHDLVNRLPVAGDAVDQVALLERLTPKAVDVHLAGLPEGLPQIP